MLDIIFYLIFQIRKYPYYYNNYYNYYCCYYYCSLISVLSNFHTLWAFGSAVSVKRGGGIRDEHTVFRPYLSVKDQWIILPLQPSVFAIALNTLGCRRDLFSASLMHHVNGAVILFSAPEGLLRLVKCAGAVRSLPISRQIIFKVPPKCASLVKR